MTRRPTVLLFDVDGTLITCSGVGRRALEAGFEDVTGARDAFAFSFGGMTDRAIVRRGLRNVGLDDADATIDRVLEAYVARLAYEVRTSYEYVVHPGVYDILEAVESEPDVVAGLGTGNLREGARLKLEPPNLFARFRFGGFGCDHEERVELLRAGAQRGAEALGYALSACRVVIIGDTPRDIVAARALHAESVAVATGEYGVDELRSYEPTVVFMDLLAEGAFTAILGRV